MPAAPDVPRFDDYARRWLELAERRERYFSELYRSGHWRRYYTAEAFAESLIETMRTVAAWRHLAGEPRQKPADDLRSVA